MSTRRQRKARRARELRNEAIRAKEQEALVREWLRLVVVEGLPVTVIWGEPIVISEHASRS